VDGQIETRSELAASRYVTERSVWFQMVMVLVSE